MTIDLLSFPEILESMCIQYVILQLLDVYFKRNKSGKLKHLSVATSFVRNQCSKHVAFNGYYKKQRLSKLSMIVDSNGVPISALITEGNHNDQKLFHRNWKNLFVEITSNNNNNKHKRYLLADAIYDAERVRQSAISKNITPIIWKENTRGVLFNYLKIINKYLNDEL